MTGLIELVSGTLADPLGTARAQASAGRRVIGLLGRDIPVELVTAAGAFALQLPAIPDRPTALADRYLESVFSPSTRSITQQWLSGELDFIDTVVMSRANDSAQRLYYYLCELQRMGLTAGPRLLLYDIAKIPRPASVEHTLQATHRLARALGTTDSELPTAIALRNRRRSLFEALGAQRRSSSPPRGSTVERIAHTADLGMAAIFDDALEHWLQEPRAVWSGPRLLLAGSEPPDARLHTAVEAAGGRVVDEAGDHSLERIGPPLPVDAKPLHALSTHYQALRYGPRSFQERVAVVAERVARCATDGVIFWLIEEDESMVWDVPAITQALHARHLPLLTLSRRRWDATDDAPQRIAAFVADLRAAS